MINFEDYNCLLPNIGIDMKVAMPFFIENGVDFKPRGYNKIYGGFPEELLAFSFDLSRPTSKKGVDFKQKNGDKLGDCKAVKSRILKKPYLK